MLLMGKRSENVLAGCSACGGGEMGFIRRTGPGGHAEWCPTHNAKMRPLFVRHVNFVPVAEREDQHARIAERRQFVVDLHDDGYPIREIAEMLGVSSWTVRDDLAEMQRH